MHTLITQAIEDASKNGRHQLSLAALPARKSNAKLGRLIAYLSGSAGLVQFKDSFAPHYRPLYMAAPNRLSLGISMLDLAQTVTSTTCEKTPPPAISHQRDLPHLPNCAT
ncbi:hypothetical protein KO498_10410 [Lentibacter algarum]|nr:hypothetical protein [Lentibacter algarum]MBU2982219.1 hypothetical protein [Lentibacter algarum]